MYLGTSLGSNRDDHSLFQGSDIDLVLHHNRARGQENFFFRGASWLRRNFRPHRGGFNDAVFSLLAASIQTQCQNSQPQHDESLHCFTSVYHPNHDQILDHNWIAGRRRRRPSPEDYHNVDTCLGPGIPVRRRRRVGNVASRIEDVFVAHYLAPGTHQRHFTTKCARRKSLEFPKTIQPRRPGHSCISRVTKKIRLRISGERVVSQGQWIDQYQT